ncbi:Crp/Fnr family transcriptional regulator [Desulfitobacterium hafniense]|uniref:Crp/Fnr family transcriptional regulator n=1 Tax=Desulfitobacterium hafniense (strain Y51) TaxID=138119 RepID=Q24N34_DESHY|nr:Crp/Fnr family transcriptional regulator [Desulfitobacterium hafniense]BAE86558.1 hypothetical protein DSY4769 [Desulfitobacterium hafniense Y51]
MLAIYTKYYNLDDHTKELLAHLGTPREYKPGEFIYHQDEPASGLVYLEEGRIKNLALYPDGTEKALCILEAPSITGETAVIDGGTSICSAMAVTRVRIVFIPREKAQELLYSNPNLMMLILNYMALKMRSMQMQAQEIVSNTPQRLAYLLLNYKKYGIFVHNEHDPRLYIKHDELASFIGTTRPKITEHLNVFMAKGLIEKGRGYIVIKDTEGLKKISKL